MLESLIISALAQQEYDALQGLLKRAVFYTLEHGNKKFDLIHDKSISMDSSHEDVVAAFPVDEARFVYLNLEYFEGTEKCNKTIFVLWVPESVSVKDKMIYAGWALMTRKKLGMPSLSVQSGDATELEYAELVTKCREHND